MKVGELIRLLEDDGWRLARTRGSHRQYKHASKPGMVTVAGKPSRFAFPTTWHYDVLRGLDYLRGAGVEPDERVAEAVSLVASRRHQDGRWPLHDPHPDPVDFDMEGGTGKPSRWNTLRALRVLDWYSAQD